MKKLLILAGFLASCATVNPYAYSGVVTKPECEAQCASYGYPLITVENGGCICDTFHCARGRNACEKLPVNPAAVNPAHEM